MLATTELPQPRRVVGWLDRMALEPDETRDRSHERDEAQRELEQAEREAERIGPMTGEILPDQEAANRRIDRARERLETIES